MIILQKVILYTPGLEPPVDDLQGRVRSVHIVDSCVHASTEVLKGQIN